MTREIERKFIISKIPNSLPKIKIKQGYLQTDKDRTVRIRSTSDQKGLLKNILTIKGPSSKNGMSRLEYETSIPNKNAKELFNLCYKPLIKKTRHIYMYEGMKWELDEFHGANKGLLIGEIELETESIVFVKPNFLLEEVTGQKKYYNSMLLMNPFCEWGKKT